jgi:hypothetical protein
MSAIERLHMFSHAEGILLFDNEYRCPEFSESELVNIYPSLTWRVTVKSK